MGRYGTTLAVLSSLDGSNLPERGSYPLVLVLASGHEFEATCPLWAHVLKGNSPGRLLSSTGRDTSNAKRTPTVDPNRLGKSE